MKLPRPFYTIYDKNDDIVCSGNSDQCAAALGCKSVDSFYCLVSRCLRGTEKKYTVVKDCDPE